MRILVSGIASDIGFNCGRILRGMTDVKWLGGIDIHGDHAGPCLFDTCDIAPRASEPEYLPWLSQYLTNRAIDVFLPTSEAEIARISNVGSSMQSAAKILIASRKVVETSLDKDRCLNVLADCGIPVPAHGIVGEVEPALWPVIVKPRSGQGSKGLSIFHNQFDYAQSAAKGYVWQQMLLPEDEEYTCPVYRTPAAGMRILILRRTLQGGLTGRGTVVDSPEIYAYVEAIANALDLYGAMNVQLRRTNDGPRLFEINPRLSSTVMFRHLMGFQDLYWSIMELAGHVVADYRPVDDGTRFYRGSQEYLIASPTGMAEVDRKRVGPDGRDEH